MVSWEPVEETEAAFVTRTKSALNLKDFIAAKLAYNRLSKVPDHDGKDWILDEDHIAAAAAATGLNESIIRASIRAYWDQTNDIVGAKPDTHVAVAHVRETDTYLETDIEVLDGEFFQPSDTPVKLYVASPEYNDLEQKFGDLVRQVDELRRACAELLGADSETWPTHGNWGVAIAAALALARKGEHPR